MILVFEGIDGSGKTTQARKLRDHLSSQGIPNLLLHWYSFVIYKYDEIGYESSISIKSLKSARSFGPEYFSLWHRERFAQRWESEILPALKRNKFIVMDRYKYTAIVRDVIRGLDDLFVQNLYDFVPEPSILFYLDLEPEIAYKRLISNDQGKIGFYEAGKDLYPTLSTKEGFLSFQNECRKRYKQVLPKGNTYIIKANNPIRVIQNQILEIINNLVF